MAANPDRRDDTVSAYFLLDQNLKNRDPECECMYRDRAVYDPSLSAYVSYSVAASTDAPSILTFGPSFMTLAGQYAGRVVLGEFEIEKPGRKNLEGISC